MATHGSEKTIYFLEPVLIKQSGAIEEIETGFWPRLHRKVKALSDIQRRFEYRGRKLMGEARICHSPAADYIYVGRARRGADWPDFSDATGIVTSLPISGDQGVALIEPAYLAEVTGTNYVSMVRTTGGPSTQAIQEWINMVMGMINTGDHIELRPYVRRDEMERLAAAQGATRFHMKVDAHQMEDQTPAGQMTEAMQSVQRALQGNASVELIVSFGNTRPDDVVSHEVAAEVQRIVGKMPASKLEATVLRPGDNGELIRDKINFIRDRVTAKEYVGESEDEPVTPEAMLSALHQAIRKFRKQLAD
jgi:hypothetical protein